jgi:hypothetical protein
MMLNHGPANDGLHLGGAELSTELNQYAEQIGWAKSFHIENRTVSGERWHSGAGFATPESATSLELFAVSAIPSRMVIEISAAEPVRLRQQLRRARWGGWLALPILLLLSQQRSPTAIADSLFCSRSTVYAAAWA